MPSADPKRRLPRRRLFQAAVLAAFFMLLYRAAWPLDTHLRLKIFLELDPFFSLVSMIAARILAAGLFLSLITIAASLVFGRVFCGYLCPMGITLDLFDAAGIGGLRKKRPPFEPGKAIGIKHAVLGASAAAAALGVSLVFLFDPLSVFTRFSALVIYPLSVSAANAALDAVRPAADAAGLLALSHARHIQPVFEANVTIALIIAAMALLNLIAYRGWCRYLCPAGAMMGLLGLMAPWRRRVSDACDQCGICRVKCHMGCIPEDAVKTRQAECIACHSCVRVCPKGAVSFGFGPIAGEKDPVPAVTLRGRRLFLGSLLGGGFTAGIFKTAAARPTDRKDPLPLRENRLIRPPGALPEPEFLPACTRCGECMRACVTNTIQPSWFEAGPEGLWTPRLLLRYGPCEQQCNVCGQVCPTGAIRDLPIDEKLHARIGTALIVKERCIAWEQDKRCLICDEQCPYNAIVMKREPGHENTVPHVVQGKCNGCGQCEDRCPVLGESAIIIEAEGEIRIRTGSYVETARELGLEFVKQPPDDFDAVPPDDTLRDDGKKRE
jgi:MauM/NapG family ferredoxin protein